MDYVRLSRIVFLVSTLALTPTTNSLLFAQAAPSVSHRLETSAEFGLTEVRPYIGYSAARTPPSYEPVDDASRTLLAGLGFRVQETPKTSTAVRVQWGSVGEVTVTTFGATWNYPSIDYKLDRRLDTRTFTVSVSQALDFRPGTRERPWLGAGFALSRLSADQLSIQTGVSDPNYHYSTSESFRLTRMGVTFGGGVRFYPANHLVVGTEAGMLWLAGDAKGTGIYGSGATWTVPSEYRLFGVFQVGVAF